MKKNITILFVCLFNLMFSQTNYYLEGKLGKSTIYVSIQDYDTKLECRYFYQNSLKDIVLRGNRKNSVFEVAFKDLSTEKIIEKFELTLMKNGHFKGFWMSEKGKKIAVELLPINFSNYSKPSFNFFNEIDRIKLSHIIFKQDSTSNYKGKEIVWYSETHCKSPFFRLGEHFSEKTKSILNPILNQIHIENTLSQLSCSTQFDYSEGNGIEHDISINFLNENLLGFEVFSYWDCGGAHPDFGGNGYLIDLNNGKQYEIDDIIAFDSSVTTEEKSSFQAFSNYRTNFFAPKLLALINETEHFIKPDENSEENCDYTETEYWDFPSWSITEKGILFTPYFYRAARSCEEPFLVPFEKLKKYKNNEFPYNLD